MEAIVSKRVKNISNPHMRLGAYLDLVELISGSYGEKANPQTNYLVVTAESDGIPEEKHFGIQPLEDILEYLKQVKIIGIEHSIPGSFSIGSRLWYLKGEGVTMYGNEVGLFCYDIDSDRLRDLQKLVKNSSKEYAIEFAGKRIYGES